MKLAPTGKRKRNAGWKSVRTALARLIFGMLPESAPPGPTKGPIALVRWDGKYGDWVVSAFLFEAIRASGVESMIAICDPLQEELYKKTHGVDYVIVCKRKNVFDIFCAGMTLRRLNCDMLIELNDHPRWSDLMLMALSRARIRIKGRGPEMGAFFNLLNFPAASHVIERNWFCLDAIGIPRRDWRFAWSLPINASAKAEVEWGKRAGPRIVINPFAAGADRMLPREWVERFVGTVSEHASANFVVPAPPGVDADWYRKLMPTLHVASMSAIEETAALIQVADLVISPDTAIVHIACLFDRPLIALYSNDEDNFNRWRPWSPRAAVVRPLPSEEGSSSPQLCNISPDRVADMVIEMLGGVPRTNFKTPKVER